MVKTRRVSDYLVVGGDLNLSIGDTSRRESNAVVGLYGLGTTNDAENSLLEWCKTKELFVLFSAMYSQDDTLIENSREAGRVTGNLCPIVVVDLLVQYLCPSVHQLWLLERPVFRWCLLAKSVSFRQLVEVIPEIVAHWNDIILFLNSNAMFRASGSS